MVYNAVLDERNCSATIEMCRRLSIDVMGNRILPSCAIVIGDHYLCVGLRNGSIAVYDLCISTTVSIQVQYDCVTSLIFVFLANCSSFTCTWQTGCQRFSTHLSTIVNRHRTTDRININRSRWTHRSMAFLRSTNVEPTTSRSNLCSQHWCTRNNGMAESICYVK